MTVAAARLALARDEADKLLDTEQLTKDAVAHAEQNGIVFLDEIDKVCARTGEGGFRGGDVSREGVQRDLLPLIEGTTVTTKYGPVKTDHVLFIASGAFHLAKPSDLLPELQGRLPIRVELSPLSRADLRRILVEPEHSLLKQYAALMGTEGVTLDFPRTRSTRWRSWRPTSTTAWRTSARGGWRRCWRSCWRRSASPPPTAAARRCGRRRLRERARGAAGRKGGPEPVHPVALPHARAAARQSAALGRGRPRFSRSVVAGVVACGTGRGAAARAPRRRAKSS